MTRCAPSETDLPLSDLIADLARQLDITPLAAHEAASTFLARLEAEVEMQPSAGVWTAEGWLTAPAVAIIRDAVRGHHTHRDHTSALKALTRTPRHRRTTAAREALCRVSPWPRCTPRPGSTGKTSNASEPDARQGDVGPLRHTGPVSTSDLTSASGTALPVDVLESIRETIDQARSPNTTRAYTSAWNTWAQWASDHGHSPLPADPLTLAAYLVQRSAKAHPGTLNRPGVAGGCD